MLTGVRPPLANDPPAASAIRPDAQRPPAPRRRSLARRAGPAACRRSSPLPEVIKDAAVNEFPGQGAGLPRRPLRPVAASRPTTTRPASACPTLRRRPTWPRGRLADRRACSPARPALAGRGRRPARRPRRPTAAGLRPDPLAGRPPRPSTWTAEPDRRATAYGAAPVRPGLPAGAAADRGGRAAGDASTGTTRAATTRRCWDTHENNFPHLRKRLLPPADRAVAALLEDLSPTAACWTRRWWSAWASSAARPGQPKGGRDHWPHVAVDPAGRRRASRRAGSTGRRTGSGAYPADEAGVRRPTWSRRSCTCWACRRRGGARPHRPAAGGVPGARPRPVLVGIRTRYPIGRPGPEPAVSRMM